MIYRKIKASLLEAPDRFYRVLQVREDVNLEELGVILGTALGAEFEHMFMFRKGKVIFVDEFWMDGYFEEYVMKDCGLDVLGDKFRFIYDTGDNWEFDCKIYKKVIENDNDGLAYLIDGEGQGIWEDNKWTLMRYLAGELDPSIAEEDENRGVYFPWNFEIERLSDFDEMFDLEMEAEGFDQLAQDSLDLYRNSKEEYNRTRSEIMDDSDEYDEDEEDEDDDGFENVIRSFTAMTQYQIENDPYVTAVFEELCDTMDEQEALSALTVVLMDEIAELVQKNRISDAESYQEKIEFLLKHPDSVQKD